MARLPFLDQSDLAEEDREHLKRPINLFRLLANSPLVLRNFKFGTWLRFGSTVDARLRELAILQVGYSARAPYEWSHHIKVGADFGVTDADIRGLIAESEGRDSGLPALERAVLRAARQMTTGLKPDDATFAELLAALGPDHLTQLVLAIAHYNAVVRVLETFEIDIEPEYQAYLRKFPLPA